MFASILRHGFRALGYFVAGAMLVLLVLLLRYLFAGPPIPAWNDHRLREEFTADRAGEVRTLEDYRRLEDRLFAERDEMLREAMKHSPARGRFNRFDPQRYLERSSGIFRCFTVNTPLQFNNFSEYVQFFPSLVFHSIAH